METIKTNEKRILTFHVSDTPGGLRKAVATVQWGELFLHVSRYENEAGWHIEKLVRDGAAVFDHTAEPTTSRYWHPPANLELSSLLNKSLFVLTP